MDDEQRWRVFLVLSHRCYLLQRDFHRRKRSYPMQVTRRRVRGQLSRFHHRLPLHRGADRSRLCRCQTRESYL